MLGMSNPLKRLKFWLIRRRVRLFVKETLTRNFLYRLLFYEAGDHAWVEARMYNDSHRIR